MMYLIKEATNKDQTSKMKMLLSLDNNKKAPTEKIWTKNSFFGGGSKADLAIFKPNFPENNFFYPNQDTIFTMKTGDYVIYLDYVVIGQLIPVNNLPEDLDDYELKPNEAFIYLLWYNTENSFFQCIKKWLAYIMISGNSNEIFYSYGFDEEKSKILYLTHKLPLPNIFQGTAFKKHYSKLIDERQQFGNDFSKLFFILPTTTDCKE